MLQLRSLFASPKPGQTHLSSTSIPDLTDKIIRPENQYCAAGGFGDVFRCRYMSEDGVKEVAVKAFRFKFSVDEQKHDEKKTIRMIRRELGIWRRLSHPNIVPFLGIAHGFGRQESASLVSLWMPHGTLHAFLEAHDDRLTDADRLQLLLDIANGLNYLHSFPVVHGDLSSNNVLLNHNHNACLTDFGMSSTKPGTLRWAAPEHFSLTEDETKHTIKSDIYSFGNLAFLVLSGKYPWSEVRVDAAVVLRLSQGLRPARPLSRPIDDRHWVLIERCWSLVPRRPSAEDLVTSLRQLLTTAGAFGICGLEGPKDHVAGTTLGSALQLDPLAGSDQNVATTSTAVRTGNIINTPCPSQSVSRDQEAYTYKAKAVCAYTAVSLNELSFTMGEILDVLDPRGIWWLAKKSDGTTGAIPSYYFQIIANPSPFLPTSLRHCWPQSSDPTNPPSYFPALDSPHEPQYGSQSSCKSPPTYRSTRGAQHACPPGLSLDVGDNDTHLHGNSLHTFSPDVGPSPRHSASPGPSQEPVNSESSNRAVKVLRCTSCKVTSTPEWRKGPSGKKELCNACGLRYARFRAKQKGHVARRQEKGSDPSRSSPIAIAGSGARNNTFSRASSTSSFGSVSGSGVCSRHGSVVFEPSPSPQSSSLDLGRYSYSLPSPPSWGLHNEGQTEFQVATTRRRKIKRFTFPTPEYEISLGGNTIESPNASFASPSSLSSASGSNACSRHSSVVPEPSPSPLSWSPYGSDDDTSYLARSKLHNMELGIDASDSALTSHTLNTDGTPKRPMNAFMIFARRRRPQVAAENQSMRTGEVSKILGQEWHGMSLSEKQFYLDQARILKDNFNQKYPDYVYKRRLNNSRKRRRPSPTSGFPTDCASSFDLVHDPPGSVKGNMAFTDVMVMDTSLLSDPLDELQPTTQSRASGHQPPDGFHRRAQADDVQMSSVSGSGHTTSDATVAPSLSPVSSYFTNWESIGEVTKTGSGSSHHLGTATS